MLLLLLALALLLCAVVTGTLAFLKAQSKTVENTFTVASTSLKIKEGLDDGIKSNVTVENTSDIDVYIRAAIIISWVDESGAVYAQSPTASDYQLELNRTDWVVEDGYYYCKSSVEAGKSSPVLIERCSPKPTNSAPDGYNLQVTILAEAIQADGTTTSDVKAVVNAWGVDPETLTSGT
jgi:hypothetical protein